MVFVEWGFEHFQDKNNSIRFIRGLVLKAQALTDFSSGLSIWQTLRGSWWILLMFLVSTAEIVFQQSFVRICQPYA